MKEKCFELIKECLNPWRYQILLLLSKRKYKFSEMVKELNAPKSTISRALSRLEELEMVRKQGEVYEISSYGDLILATFENLVESFEFEEEIKKAEEFLKMLPPYLKHGFPLVLRFSEKFEFLDGVIRGLEDLSRVREYGLYIDRIINYDIYKLMVNLNLQGASEKVISSRDTLRDRLETIRQVLVDMDLSKKEMRIVRDKIEIRVYDTPLLLGVLDGELVYFQYYHTYSPMFRSENKEAVEWCENVFYYFWKRASPVDVKGMIDELIAEI